MSFFRKLLNKDKKQALPSDGNPNTNLQPDNGLSTQVHAQEGQSTGKVFIPGPPHTNVSGAQNAGMLGGAILGGESGVGTATGAVDGLVVGNIVGQRINQAQKHEYWREQALNYEAGLPAAGVGDPNVVTPTGTRDRSHRDDRRKKRWSRRAERKAA